MPLAYSWRIRYTYLYSGYAVFGMTSHIVCLNVQYLPSTLALLVYDWLLCLDYEARLIWNWHSRVAGSSLLYAFSRYAVLMSNFLSILTAYPLSDSVCSFPATLIYVHSSSPLQRYTLIGSASRNSTLIPSVPDSCTVIGWTQIVSTILGTIAFSGAFKPILTAPVY